MSLSKNVSFVKVAAAPASKKDKLFGLSREDLKIVTGANGVIIANPMIDEPLSVVTDPAMVTSGTTTVATLGATAP